MASCVLRLLASGLLILAGAGVATACGGRQSQPAAVSDEKADAAAGEPTAPASDPDAPVGASPSEADEADVEHGGDEEVDDAPREVRYLVKPDGLQIDIEGARFRPRAEAIRVGGGWGVRVEVEATSHDDRTHSLLSSEQGALAFAGRVERRGKERHFSDQRRGGEEQMLFPGAPVTLSRDWPGDSGEAALRAGDELDLEVGLWGLALNMRDRRPVTRFFLVRMSVGRKRPSPLITPPKNL